MKDAEIVALYWSREEEAVRQTQNKYERYLMTIAGHILASPEDAGEAVNDTYLAAWNSMPEQRPERLSAYLGKLVRQISIDLFRRSHSRKRGGGEYVLSLEELQDCCSGEGGGIRTPEQQLLARELADSVQAYLSGLSREKRQIFLCRYFFLDPIKEIASYTGYSEGKIKSILYRIRQGLKEYLIKEGYDI